MAEPDDEIDEVALNVLLAEGLDAPTAWEASRRDSSAESPESAAKGCTGAVVLLAVAALVIVILLL